MEEIYFSGFSLFRESFDSGVQFSKRIERHGITFVQNGEFSVNDKQFIYKLEIEMDEMTFSFHQNTQSGLSMDDENNLNKKEVLSVFSTVLDIVKEYKDEVDLILLEPTTKKKFDVYFAIAKRFTDDFDVVHRGLDIILKRRK